MKNNIFTKIDPQDVQYTLDMLDKPAVDISAEDIEGIKLSFPEKCETKLYADGEVEGLNEHLLILTNDEKNENRSVLCMILLIIIVVCSIEVFILLV